jgi:hypothetical protein
MHIIDQPLRNAGSFTPGYKPRIVWHTTEGHSYPGPEIYHGTNPHFTCDFKRRRTYQHCPMNVAAMALRNPPGGVETNRANAIQVELVGLASESGLWTPDDYAYIHELARHIEKARDVPRRHIKPWTHSRMTNTKWREFSGHCGHMHVPENDHTDPGMAFHIDRIV